MNTRTAAIDFNPTEAKYIAGVAEKLGWQSAAHDVMRSLDARAYRLAIDEYSAQVRFLLPLTPASKVLLVRAGWGSVAMNVAASAGSVVAMDDRTSRLRFLAARHNAAPAGTIDTIQGSLERKLPFASGEFDAVIMLDALEHIGTAGIAGAASRRAVYRRAMAEVNRVLAPDGKLLLGVPNKLGFARPDAGEPIRTQTYAGYRKTLQRAGFNHIEFYAPLPSHHEPFFILPLARSRLLGHFIQWMFTAQDYRSKLEARGMGAAYQAAWALWRAGRHLRLVGLIKYVVPSYLVVAGK
jgi:SAM-dependent methyltransferase